MEYWGVKKKAVEDMSRCLDNTKQMFCCFSFRGLPAIYLFVVIEFVYRNLGESLDSAVQHS